MDRQQQSTGRFCRERARANAIARQAEGKEYRFAAKGRGRAYIKQTGRGRESTEGVRKRRDFIRNPLQEKIDNEQ